MNRPIDCPTIDPGLTLHCEEAHAPTCETEIPKQRRLTRDSRTVANPAITLINDTITTRVVLYVELAQDQCVKASDSQCLTR